MQETIKNVDRYLKVNTKLNIKLSSDVYTDTYDSRIEDYDKSVLFIAVPSDKGVPIPLRKGMKIEVSCLTDQGRMSFESQVVDLHKQRIPLISIEKPEFLLKEQYRGFYRVETRLNLTVFLCSQQAYLDEQEKLRIPQTKAIAQDISGGGSKITTPKPLPEGETVVLDFTTSENPELGILEGIVMKTVLATGKFTSAIKFHFQDERDQDRVVKYVFHRQIELRNILGRD